VWALHHLSAKVQDLGEVFLDFETLLRPPQDRKRSGGDPQSIVSVIEEAIDAGFDNFLRFTEIGLFWIYLQNNVALDGLRRLASHYLRDERSAATLQPTALVHEAYLRLVAQNLPDWESRSHFFGVAAHLMRQVLVDHARQKRSEKRGGGAAQVSIEETVSFAPGPGRDIQALDDALRALAEIDPRKVQVIELRFFGGLSIEETAQALGISVATVRGEQRLAEAWLHREMSGRSEPES
jgi:RNA polymerase sigma factor (TIGR02999 family)